MTIYTPIHLHQTRVMRVHGDGGDPNSTLVCTLYTADILHSSFNGFGLRSQLKGEICPEHQNERCSVYNQEDVVVAYVALSYVWGGRTRQHHIICNGVEFPVTANLFDALSAIRQDQSEHQFLWVDAVCINQDDMKERSRQVSNMFTIYQNATKVIAWLGPAQENLKDVLNARALVYEKEVKFKPVLYLKEDSGVNLQAILSGLDCIYSYDYFKRMWIQQEIFAARDLVFQSGQYRFRWGPYLSDPQCFLRRPPADDVHLLPPQKQDAKRKLKLWKSSEPEKQTADPVALSFEKLESQCQEKLGCFLRFYSSRLSQEAQGNSRGHDPNSLSTLKYDFIDTLMDTSRLSLTDPRDYIYGLLGITGFPAKSATIEDWTKARRTGELFIPIDYSSDLKSILCAVSWILIMKGGLGILAKFKVLPNKGETDDDDRLPSWVIDWRLAAQDFRRVHNGFCSKLETAWDFQKMFPQTQRMTYSHTPNEHKYLHSINKLTKLSITKLVVRGSFDDDFFVKERHVCKKAPFQRSRKLWELTIDACPTDIVVSLDAFVYGRSNIYFEALSRELESNGGGLWLLRPARGGYSLVACLPWVDASQRTLYGEWQYGEYLRGPQFSFPIASYCIHNDKLQGLKLQNDYEHRVRSDVVEATFIIV